MADRAIQKEAALQVEEFADQIEAMRDRLRQCAERNHWLSLHQNVNQLPLPQQNWLEEVLQEVGAFLEELWAARLCPWKGEPFDPQLFVTASPDQEQESGNLPCVRDIILAQQAEQRLRENEERFQSLSACSPVGIFLTDVEGRCTYTNPRCQAICGFTLEESLGVGWSQSVYPEDRERVFADWSKSTREGREYSDEFRFQTKEGTVRWVHIRSSPMFSDKGKLIGHVGTVEDITERKQAAQRLKDSEHRLRTIIETEPECVKLVAADGTLLDMNAAGLAMIEAPSADAVMGQSVYSLITPEHREAFIALNESVCQGNRGSLEFEIIGLQGTRRWMETHAVPLPSESDGTLIHLAITRDITVRKQAEEELRQLNTALENAVEGISRLDTQGRYITVNKAYASTLGYQPEEMIGMAWQQTVHPDDVPKLIDVYQQMLKTGKAEVEARAVRKDGSNFYKQVVMVAAYDSRHQFIGHHCFAKDITERKIAEEAIKQAKQELEIRVEERTAQLRTINEQLLREISERKRAEEELEHSLSLLRGTLEATADGIIVSQNGTHIATVNQKFIEMWGIHESVIASQEIKQLVPLLVEQLKEPEAFISQTQGLLSQVDAEGYGIVELEDGRIFERYSLPQRIGGNIVGRVCSFRDITERRRKEAELAESQRRLASLINSLPGIAFSCSNDPEWSMRYLSEGCLNLTGYTSEELLESGVVSYNSITHPEDLPKVLSTLEQAVANKQPYVVEYRIRTQSGEEKWVWEKGSGVFGSKGEVLGVEGFITDISDRKQSEKALQEKEEFLELVLENIPQFIFWKDRNSVYFGCNRNFALAAGCSTPEEIVGKTDYDLPWKQEEADFFRECDARVMETDTPEYHIIEPQLQANGKQAWVDTNKVPLHDAQGNVVGILGTYEDITERRQAELELQQSEQKYRNLFHNSLVGMFRNSLADGTVLDANEAVLKMFGFDSYQGVRTIDLYANPADRENLKQQLLEQGFVENFESQVRRQDGSLFWVSYSGKLYGKEGYLEGVMIDITERKQAEEALRTAKQELEIRVEERTTELRQAIRKLQGEIEERKRTAAELQRSEARFRDLACRETLLNRLASQIRNSLALETILETAVQEIYHRLAIDVCVFAWYTKDGTSSGWDVVKEAKNPDLPSFLGLYPLESWRPFTCKLVDREDFQVDQVTQSHEAVQQTRLPYGTTALLSLPIETQSGQLGTLTCGRLVSWQSWTDEELELLQAVANQLAIGINQAQLYEQSRIAATTAQTKATQLEVALRELQQTQSQLIQSEKMSSLGQLVAGVAHEINNPLNFIHGNLSHINQYAKDLLNLIQLYQEYYTRPALEIQAETEAIDLEFIKEDLPKILSSMTMGTDRIRQIVLSLRNFSRAEQTERKWVDIHEGLDNTLLILGHRLKDKGHRPSIEIIKEYGNLPLVKCYAGQLNQVFMNILTNAIDALEMRNESWAMEPEPGSSYFQLPSPQSQFPKIWIRTEVNESHQLVIRIADNGLGMTKEIQRRIFDPFFTTKPIGSGTGLGMSISYQIVVEKHGGQLQCISAPNQGTEFLISIPIHPPKNNALAQENLAMNLAVEGSANRAEFDCTCKNSHRTCQPAGLEAECS
ncbi:PAS domain S-box protein [Microcoleus sp. ZQ-A2]|nr:PAS domain S-box protein [Microcoleus sp. FACHB-1]